MSQVQQTFITREKKIGITRLKSARLKRQLLIGLKRQNVISSVQLKGFVLSTSFTRSSTANAT